MDKKEADRELKKRKDSSEEKIEMGEEDLRFYAQTRQVRNLSNLIEGKTEGNTKWHEKRGKETESLVRRGLV